MVEDQTHAAVFSLRLLTVHTHMNSAKITLFGTTTKGVKAAVHLEHIRPYFYTDLPANIEEFKEALEKELVKKTNGGKQKCIDRITKCRAMPFYGFHAKEKIFAKIYLGKFLLS